MHYLALCAIVKDEDLYLREWLAFYTLLGVEHFYIFDNDSHRPAAELLHDISPKLVTIEPVSGLEQQIPAYNQVIKKYKDQCRWLGFLDIDEFLFPLKGRDLRPVLAEFEDYAGLAVPWTMYGSSGHIKKPDGLVIENYLQRYDDHQTNWHSIIKCLVNPKEITEVLSPHCFLPMPGRYLVTEQHIPVAPASTRAVRASQKLRLNHYFFKSQQEYEAKLQRGRADRADEAGRYKYDLFHDQCRQAGTMDAGILPFCKATRKRMADLAAFEGQGGCDLPLHVVNDMISAFSTGNKFEEAEAAFCRTKPEETITPDFWLFRGIMAKARGALERSEIFIKKALRLKESAHIYWELADIFMARKDKENALATLNCLQGYVYKHAKQLEDKDKWLERIAKAKSRAGI